MSRIDFANGSHVEQMAKLFQLVIAGVPYYSDAAKKSALNDLSEQNIEDAVYGEPIPPIVALDDEGKVVGFCLSRSHDGGVWWLSWIVVDPELRRLGISQQLLAFLSEAVKRVHGHAIWCDCRTENEPSINMLSSAGFRQICRINNHWHSQDFFLWQKQVTA